MNKLNVLILVTVAVCAGAWFASYQADQQFGLEQGKPLYSDLAKQLGGVDHIQIIAAGGETSTLQNQDGQWRLLQRQAYPADIKPLSQALRQLAKSQTLEAKTSSAANYAQLGVQDTELAKEPTIQLIAKAGEQTVIDLIVGKSNRSGSYVRKNGDTQSWLIDQRLSLPRNIADYLDKALIAIPRQDVQSVTVTPLNGETYTLSKAGADAQSFELQPKPGKGREINAANSNRLAAALSNLRISDVLASDSLKDVQWSQAVVRNGEGLELHLELAKSSDAAQRYLKLSAAMSSTMDGEDDGNSALQQRIDDLNARAKGRVFVAPQYTVDALMMSHDMLLKTPPKQEKS